MATVRSYTARVRPGMQLPATIGEQVTLGATTLYFKGGVGVGFVMERVPGRGQIALNQTSLCALCHISCEVFGSPKDCIFA